jgi:hypothetical protein
MIPTQENQSQPGLVNPSGEKDCPICQKEKKISTYRSFKNGKVYTYSRYACWHCQYQVRKEREFINVLEDEKRQVLLRET